MLRQDWGPRASLPRVLRPERHQERPRRGRLQRPGSGRGDRLAGVGREASSGCPTGSSPTPTSSATARRTSWTGTSRPRSGSGASASGLIRRMPTRPPSDATTPRSAIAGLSYELNASPGRPAVGPRRGGRQPGCPGHPRPHRQPAPARPRVLRLVAARDLGPGRGAQRRGQDLRARDGRPRLDHRRASAHGSCTPSNRSGRSGRCSRRTGRSTSCSRRTWSRSTPTG